MIEDMEVLQYEIHKPIDCDVIAIIRYTIIVSVSGIGVPLLLLWVLKTVDIRSPKTVISVHFSSS